MVYVDKPRSVVVPKSILRTFNIFLLHKNYCILSILSLVNLAIPDASHCCSVRGYFNMKHKTTAYHQYYSEQTTISGQHHSFVNNQPIYAYFMQFVHPIMCCVVVVLKLCNCSIPSTAGVLSG